MEPVDILGWEIDERFSPYPEGSRDKYAVLSPPKVADQRIVPKHRYLVKFSNDRYPVQFWSEIIAEMLGTHMDIPVPKSFLTIDPKSGVPASLTSWFYGKAIEQQGPHEPATSATVGIELGLEPQGIPHSHSLYVPGSNYMAKYIPDYDLEKGSQHNIETLFKFVYALRIEYKVDFWPLWALYFAFDAMIGNTDRHQDNWGVLWRKSSNDNPKPRFAPAFDNGTSLLHEILERKLQNFDDEHWRSRYIERGTHHVKEHPDAAKQIGHMRLIEILVEKHPNLISPLKSALAFNFEQFENDVKALTAIPFPVPLSPERADAILKVVSDRRNRIMQIVDPS